LSCRRLSRQQAAKPAAPSPPQWLNLSHGPIAALLGLAPSAARLSYTYSILAKMNYHSQSHTYAPLITMKEH